MTSPEPASVTASRQFAAESGDRARQVRRRSSNAQSARRPGAPGAGTAGRREVMPSSR